MITFKEFLINEARHIDFRTPEPTDFETGDPIRATALRRGMVVELQYRSQRGDETYSDHCEVLGFSGNDQKYGEGGVKYNSVKEMLAANGVRNLKELEEVDDQNEYGYHHYMILRDLTDEVITNEDNIFHAYLYKGKWSVGSSAQHVRFYEAHYVPKRKRVTEARHIASALPKVVVFDDYHEMSWYADELTRKYKQQVDYRELGFLEGMPGHYGYFGVFYYEGKPPSIRQITSLTRRVIDEMHDDPDAVNLADCIARQDSVYYENGKLSCDR